MSIQVICRLNLVLPNQGEGVYLLTGMKTLNPLSSLNNTTMKNNMIPAGYLSKTVVGKPEGFENQGLADIYSVSGCISANFADYIPFWKHNGYWLFDSPDIIEQVAQAHSIGLSGTTLFYYEMYNLEFNAAHSWKPFQTGNSFTTAVQTPAIKKLEGYDFVSFSRGNSAECSPLSCNYLANSLPVNKHCLLDSFDEACQFLEEGKIQHCEPGPYRILAVYSVSGDSPLA